MGQSVPAPKTSTITTPTPIKVVEIIPKSIPIKRTIAPSFFQYKAEIAPYWKSALTSIKRCEPSGHVLRIRGMKHLITAFFLALPTLSLADTAYDFALPSIDGGMLDLAERGGQVTLIANTASLCSFTPQYDGLQALHDQYTARGFAVVGVPSDDFGGQELSSNEAVKDFCDVNFNIVFPMTTIQDVTGRDATPLFGWLADQGARPRWNFTKFLIGRDGELIAIFPSSASPMSARIRNAVEAALAAPTG
jgi:glutathione peroxidase